MEYFVELENKAIDRQKEEERIRETTQLEAGVYLGSCVFKTRPLASKDKKSSTAPATRAGAMEWKNEEEESTPHIMGSKECF